MRLIDEIYTRCPFYGSRRIAAQLSRDRGKFPKRIQRLMRMGIVVLHLDQILGDCPRIGSLRKYLRLKLKLFNSF